MKRRLEHRLLAVWYGGESPALWMRALVPVYRFILALGSLAYRFGLRRPVRCGAPVVVVGNLTVGGTGKTPLVLWLVETLKAQGFRPGIVARGYGRQNGESRRVSPEDDAALSGDEAVLMARRAVCPVQVGRDRVAAARELVGDGCDVIVSDDGLQHRRLARDLELLVVDHERGWGNGRLLPAGPLREPVTRAELVDQVIRNGDPDGMRLEPVGLFRVRDGSPGPDPTELPAGEIHAVAGIGHPARFFRGLEARLERPLAMHPFPDHHRFSAKDFEGMAQAVVIMTEKDAVKCAHLAGSNWYYLRVDARLDEALAGQIVRSLAQLRESVHG